MKSLIFLALLALAYAEPESNAESSADSNADSYYYGYYGQPSYYGSYYGGYGRPYYGLSRSYGYGSYYGAPSYYGSSYGGYNRYWKREADSESEPEAAADPQLLYGNYYQNNPFYAHQNYYGYQQHVSPYTTYAHTAGVVGTPAVTYAAQPAVAHAAVTYAAKPVTYAADHGPVTYATHTPVTYATHTPVSYAQQVVSPYTYGHVASPVGYYANSGGAIHTVAKREAEAEPESQYYGYGGRWGGFGRNYYGSRWGGYRSPYYGGRYGSGWWY